MLLELPGFEHIDVKSSEEAVFWLHKCGERARVIAGGTDLLSLMKDRIEGPGFRVPQVLVNIKPIPEMNRLTWNEKSGLNIGAAVAISRLSASDVILNKYSILAQAARSVGATQIRNRGTAGGNICQRPRCAYFRHPHFLCFKKGGEKCLAASGEHRFYHSILGNGRCVMAHPSDLAPALVALKAEAVLVSLTGERRVLLKDFFCGPNQPMETVLKPKELLRDIVVPNQGVGIRQVFLKQRIRRSVDFALSSVSVVVQTFGKICEHASIVLGGVAPFPYVAFEAEETLRGKLLNPQTIAEAAEAAVNRAQPLPMNRFKVDLTKTLVKDALMSITETEVRDGTDGQVPQL